MVWTSQPVSSAASAGEYRLPEGASGELVIYRSSQTIDTCNVKSL
jgi:hypothetical protein